MQGGTSLSKEAYINQLIQNDKADTNLISDGYHTFGELYEHRIINFVTLCKVISNSNYLAGRIPKVYKAKGKHDAVTEEGLYDGKKSINHVWRSLKHSDGELAFGGTWFVLGIFKTPGIQITYHLPLEKWNDCAFAETLEAAPEWDGHTSSDVLDRLKQL